jgi:hypothetical protein
MPRTGRIPVQLLDKSFRGSAAIAAGLVTPSELRGRLYRRLFRDVYFAGGRRIDVAQMARGAALLLPPGAALSGSTAAWLYGARLAGAEDPVDVVSAVRFGPLSGMKIRRTDLDAVDRSTRWGLPVTTPLRTAWELARNRPLLDAVVWADAVAHAARLGRNELRDYGLIRRHRAGGLTAYRALCLADGRAESPPESILRIHFALAGLPEAIPQYNVLEDGHFIARVDLAWPWAKVAVEYDGLWHWTRERFAADRARWRDLSRAGWYVYPCTATDLQSIGAMIIDVRSALQTRR